MKCYTKRIPYELAEKIDALAKRLGDYNIQIYRIPPTEYYPDGMILPSYAMAFDWLMEKNIRITLHSYPAREPFAWGYMLWSMNGNMVYDPNPMPDMDELVCYPSWTEAADAAITKALELI